MDAITVMQHACLLPLPFSHSPYFTPRFAILVGVVLVVTWHRVVLEICLESTLHSSRSGARGDKLTEVEVVGHRVSDAEDDGEGVDDSYKSSRFSTHAHNTTHSTCALDRMRRFRGWKDPKTYACR